MNAIGEVDSRCNARARHQQKSGQQGHHDGVEILHGCQFGPGTPSSLCLWLACPMFGRLPLLRWRGVWLWSSVVGHGEVSYPAS
ncbi:MAG: hypothetical protein WCF98_05650 [Synechococcus sp. ELA057]